MHIDWEYIDWEYVFYEYAIPAIAGMAGGLIGAVIAAAILKML